MGALVDGPLTERQGEIGVVDGGVRFDGVRQGVDAAVGRHLRRTGVRQQRIDDCDARPHEIAEDADLHVLIGVGQHGGGGHLGAGASGRRHAKNGRDGTGNFVVADIVVQGAAVSDDDRGGLGEVHVAAAAEAKDGVRIELAGGGVALAGGEQRRFRFAAGENLDGDTSFIERGVDVFDEAGFEQDWIGDDQNALEAVADSDLAELLAGIGAEDERAGSMKIPGGAHAISGVRQVRVRPRYCRGCGCGRVEDSPQRTESELKAIREVFGVNGPRARSAKQGRAENGR